MSARSRRDNAPELQCSDVTRPGASTAANMSRSVVAYGQELKTEVERLKSVFSEAKDAHLFDPTPELATLVAKAEMDLINAVIRMCQAAVYAAPDSEVAAKRRELRKAQADKALLAAKLVANRCEGAALAAEEQKCDTPDSYCVFFAASNVHTALSEAKIEVLSAELDVLRAEYLIRHVDSSDVDANASVDVINKYREFAKAKAQLEVEKHKATAEKREAAAKLRADKRKADFDAVQAAYRARDPHSTEADEEASADIRKVTAKLEAEERKAAMILEAEKKLTAAELAVEERKADLAVVRSMYLFTHPGSSETHADMSDEVREVKADLAVEERQAAVVAAEARLLTVDRASRVKIDWAFQDVRRNLKTLMEAKLCRDMPSAELKVYGCIRAVGAAERDHTNAACASISLGADPESKTAFLSDLAPEAGSVVKPAPCSACLDLCPQVLSTRQKLRMAEEEEGMLRFQLEVEMHGAVFSTAKSAYSLLFPGLMEADVEASDFVSPFLHRLRKAEADRDVKIAEYYIGSIDRKIGLEGLSCSSSSRTYPRYGDVCSVKPEHSMATVAWREAVVAAAQAAHRCENRDATDASANASAHVRGAEAELEIAKRRHAVVAARAAFFSKNSNVSEVDADGSSPVDTALSLLHEAQVAKSVLRWQLSVEKLEADVRAAENNGGVCHIEHERLSLAQKTLREQTAAHRVQILTFEWECAWRQSLCRPPGACGEFSVLLAHWRRTCAELAEMVLRHELLVEQLCAETEAVQAKFLLDHPDLSDADAKASKAYLGKLDALEAAKVALQNKENEWRMHKASPPRSFAKDGLPDELNMHLSLPCTGDATFARLDSLPLLNHRFSNAWASATRIARSCASELDICSTVAASLDDASFACSASCTVSMRRELDSCTPDICIQTSHTWRVLSVAEVKKYDDPVTHMQIRRSLTLLRDKYGVCYPIGIVTCFNEWQFCWLKCASPVAEATSLDQVRSLGPPPSPTDDDYTLCVSKVYNCKDPEIKDLLVSFVLKIMVIPHD